MIAETKNFVLVVIDEHASSINDSLFDNLRRNAMKKYGNDFCDSKSPSLLH